MKKTVLAMAGSALIVLSAMQLAAASELHRSRVKHRADSSMIVPLKLLEGLQCRNECCLPATLHEDLTLVQTHSCIRRFLATPLYEIIAL